MSLASALTDTRGGESRSSGSLLKGLEKIVVSNGASALQPRALPLDPCIRTLPFGPRRVYWIFHLKNGTLPRKVLGPVLAGTAGLEDGFYHGVAFRWRRHNRGKAGS